MSPDGPIFLKFLFERSSRLRLGVNGSCSDSHGPWWKRRLRHDFHE
uniref:Uncharacterized protein n=1 Tax=Anguilla anguilla TaxID=7936 RepID=A0A0E9U823_ANGAN